MSLTRATGAAAVLVEVFFPEIVTAGVEDTCLTAFSSVTVSAHLKKCFETGRLREAFVAQGMTFDVNPTDVQEFGDIPDQLFCYEVNCFQPGKAGAPTRVEKQTVVRAVFHPDYDTLLGAVSSNLERKRLAALVKEYLRSPATTEAEFKEYYLKEPQERETLALIRNVDRWKTNMAVYIFGFLIDRVLAHPSVVAKTPEGGIQDIRVAADFSWTLNVGMYERRPVALEVPETVA